MAAHHTIEQIADALKAMNGNISAAARSLGLCRSAVWDRITKSSTLQQVCHDARQARVDIAESSLDRAVLAGEAWAVSLILRTLGRDRGYGDTVDVNVSLPFKVYGFDPTELPDSTPGE